MLTQREKYIMAHALHTAIKTMKEVKGPMREVNDIADMEEMLKTYFPHYAAVFDHIDEKYGAAG